MSEQTIQASDKSTAYPSVSKGWYAVVILTLAYVFSFLDRQILALLVTPIKRDLDLTDFQMSLLMGLAFAILYTFLGIPLGRLADRRSRRAIIAAGISTWCLMTIACGLARNYTQLFLARIGVGVGEAALSPAALSLISDYFPRAKRARAISFYTQGISIGGGLAFILGGWVITKVLNAPPVTLPLIGTLYAWQTIFLVVGLPGLVIAALMSTVLEPERQGKISLKTSSGAASEIIPLIDVLKFLTARWRTYGSHFLGMSVVTILAYAYFSWIPTMFTRTWDWTIGDISRAYGVLLLIFGPLSNFSGGWLADRLYKAGYKDGHMRAVMIGAAVFLVPFSTLAPLMPSAQWAIVAMIPTVIGGGIVTAAGASSLMMIAPNQMRGQTSAIYFFVINILGLTIGPSAVAMITDFAFADEGALRYSIAIVSGVAGAIGLLLLSYNLKHYAKSMVEAENWDRANC